MAKKATIKKKAAKTAPAKPAKSAKTPPPSVTTSAAAKKAAKSSVKAPAKPVTPTTVTLKHIAAGLAERHDMPTKHAETLLTGVFGSVINHIKAGDRVRIAGLGIIEIKHRAARMGRNPATGEAIQIKASRKVAFRASKDLKESI
jgi:DNA-binding protein HU-beta